MATNTIDLLPIKLTVSQKAWIKECLKLDFHKREEELQTITCRIFYLVGRVKPIDMQKELHRLVLLKTKIDSITAWTINFRVNKQ